MSCSPRLRSRYAARFAHLPHDALADLASRALAELAALKGSGAPADGIHLLKGSLRNPSEILKDPSRIP